MLLALLLINELSPVQTVLLALLLINEAPGVDAAKVGAEGAWSKHCMRPSEKLLNFELSWIAITGLRSS